MPFDSRAFRILIASPSDVDEEREVAIKVIQEWNDLYAYTKGVVLLPLRWETHTAPDFGTRPQEVINRAIVDQCDLLVGVFWSRVGSPTGIAESGTLEEIDRVARAGKPVMLYFSKVGIDPESIDLAQLNRLRDFKAETFPNALVESYRTHIEFRDKFARQLELRVRELQKHDAEGAPPPLALSIASSDLRSFDGAKASRVVEIIRVTDLGKERGLDEKVSERRKSVVSAHVERAATTPVVLAIGNDGGSGIRNLYVEIQIAASEGIRVTDEEPKRAGLWESNLVWTSFLEHDLQSRYEVKGPLLSWSTKPDLDEGFSEFEAGWRFAFEWAALQPDRKRLVNPPLFITADRAGKVTFMARVYAESLAQPAVLEAELMIDVRKHDMKTSELIGYEKGTRQA